VSDNNTKIQSKLENSIYKFFTVVASSSTRKSNINGHIKWVKTDSSCWPNYIFSSNLRIEELDNKKMTSLKEKIDSGSAPNSWFAGPGLSTPRFDEVLEKNGFSKAFSWPGMSLINKNINMPSTTPAEFKIEEVNEMDNLKKWSSIINSGMFGYGFNGVELFKGLLHREDIRLFLGFFKELPVSTSLLFLNSGIAILFLIATLPDYRKMGFGTLTTLAAIKKSMDYDYRYSGLFATSSGERIYKKIGFKRCCDFDIYYI